MAKHLGQIAAILGLTEEQVMKYCDGIRATVPATQAPSNRDIAQALQELGHPNATPTEVAERAKKFTAVRRAGRRGSRAQLADKMRMMNKRPMSFSRCRSCGMPAIPGSEVCYACSS